MVLGGGVANHKTIRVPTKAIIPPKRILMILGRRRGSKEEAINTAPQRTKTIPRYIVTFIVNNILYNA